jgi:hypothetical protein
MSIEEESDFAVITSDLIRDKILHTLKIYPRLSMSMLQVGIGTAISSKIWHPIFMQLKTEGRVKVEHTSARSPAGRDQTYQVISLVE